MRLQLQAFVSLALAVTSVFAVGSPTGFATGTTGGAGGATVTPTSLAQVVTYLSDSTARTVVLDRIWDFTSYYGTTTTKYCEAYCAGVNNGYGKQVLIDDIGGCDSSLTLYSATLNTAGYKTNLKVGSNKTILGKGSSAGLKGIGLIIDQATNVIVQNIAITDLNQKYVWGGDAILITGSSKVWIDHNYFARVGRQFITTGFDPATLVTISNNMFDGKTDYSASCNGHHYWAFLFTGEGESITLANNHIYYTSGRGPHIGGLYNSNVHIVNNYYDSVAGHAIDADTYSHVFAEGNYFSSVTTTDTGNPGIEFFVTDSSVSTCTSALGRTCVANVLSAASSVNRVNTAAFTSGVLNNNMVKNYRPTDATTAKNNVVANAGVGKVN